MKQQQTNKERMVAFRLTRDEYQLLERLWKATTSQKLSEYLRLVVLQKPVHVKYRNLSADALLAEIIALRKEFKAVGFNFNQVVHKLHTLHEIPEFRAWMALNEKQKEQFFQN